jgi:hypothetical protein
MKVWKIVSQKPLSGKQTPPMSIYFDAIKSGLCRYVTGAVYSLKNCFLFLIINVGVWANLHVPRLIPQLLKLTIM